MNESSSQFKSNNKKAAKHSATKPQMKKLSEQVLARARQFIREMVTVNGDVVSVTEIKRRGRRQKDKLNLEAQMVEEDAREATLRREQLTIESVQVIAANTELTNDASYVSNEETLRWREVVPIMATVKYWGDLNPASAMQKTVWAARKCLPMLDCSMNFAGKTFGDKSYQQLSTKKDTMKVIGKHVVAVKNVSKLIASFVGQEPEWLHPQTRAVDITGIFVHPFIQDVVNVIEPVEEQFVKTCTVLDVHYTSHLASNQKDGEEGEGDEGEEVDEVDEVDEVEETLTDAQLDRECT